MTAKIFPIADTLKFQRHKLNLTQTQAGAAHGSNQSWVSEIESGRKLPTRAMSIVTYAQILQLNPAKLFDELARAIGPLDRFFTDYAIAVMALANLSSIPQAAHDEAAPAGEQRRSA